MTMTMTLTMTMTMIMSMTLTMTMTRCFVAEHGWRGDEPGAGHHPRHEAGWRGGGARPSTTGGVPGVPGNTGGSTWNNIGGGGEYQVIQGEFQINRRIV